MVQKKKESLNNKLEKKSIIEGIDNQTTTKDGAVLYKGVWWKGDMYYDEKQQKWVKSNQASSPQPSQTTPPESQSSTSDSTSSFSPLGGLIPGVGLAQRDKGEDTMKPNLLATIIRQIITMIIFILCIVSLLWWAKCAPESFIEKQFPFELNKAPYGDERVNIGKGDWRSDCEGDKFSDGMAKGAKGIFTWYRNPCGRGSSISQLVNIYVESSIAANTTCNMVLNLGATTIHQIMGGGQEKGEDCTCKPLSPFYFLIAMLIIGLILGIAGGLTVLLFFTNGLINVIWQFLTAVISPSRAGWFSMFGWVLGTPLMIPLIWAGISSFGYCFEAVGGVLFGPLLNPKTRKQALGLVNPSMEMIGWLTALWIMAPTTLELPLYFDKSVEGAILMGGGLAMGLVGLRIATLMLFGGGDDTECLADDSLNVGDGPRFFGDYAKKTASVLAAHGKQIKTGLARRISEKKQPIGVLGQLERELKINPDWDKLETGEASSGELYFSNLNSQDFITYSNYKTIDTWLASARGNKDFKATFITTSPPSGREAKEGIGKQAGGGQIGGTNEVDYDIVNIKTKLVKDNLWFPAIYAIETIWTQISLLKLLKEELCKLLLDLREETQRAPFVEIMKSIQISDTCGSAFPGSAKPKIENLKLNIGNLEAFKNNIIDKRANFLFYSLLLQVTSSTRGGAPPVPKEGAEGEGDGWESEWDDDDDGWMEMAGKEAASARAGELGEKAAELAEEDKVGEEEARAEEEEAPVEEEEARAEEEEARAEEEEAPAEEEEAPAEEAEAGLKEMKERAAAVSAEAKEWLLSNLINLNVFKNYQTDIALKIKKLLEQQENTEYIMSLDDDKKEYILLYLRSKFQKDLEAGELLPETLNLWLTKQASERERAKAAAEEEARKAAEHSATGVKEPTGVDKPTGEEGPTGGMGGGGLFSKKDNTKIINDKLELYKKNFNYLQMNIAIYDTLYRAYAAVSGEDYAPEKYSSLFYLLGSIYRDIKPYEPPPLGRGVTRITRKSYLDFNPYKILPYIGGEKYPEMIQLATRPENLDCKELNIKSLLTTAARNSNIIITYALRDSIKYKSDDKTYKATLKFLISKYLTRLLIDNELGKLIDSGQAEKAFSFDIKAQQDVLKEAEASITAACKTLTPGSIVKFMGKKMSADGFLVRKINKNYESALNTLNFNKKKLENKIENLEGREQEGMTPNQLSVLYSKIQAAKQKVIEIDNKLRDLNELYEKCKVAVANFDAQYKQLQEQKEEINILKNRYKAEFMPRNFGFSLIEWGKELRIWDAIKKALYSKSLFFGQLPSNISLYYTYYFSNNVLFNTSKQAKDLLNLYNISYRVNLMNPAYNMVIERFSVALLYDICRQNLLSITNKRDSTASFGKRRDLGSLDEYDKELVKETKTRLAEGEEDEEDDPVLEENEAEPEDDSEEDDSEEDDWDGGGVRGKQSKKEFEKTIEENDGFTQLQRWMFINLLNNITKSDVYLDILIHAMEEIALNNNVPAFPPIALINLELEYIKWWMRNDEHGQEFNARGGTPFPGRLFDSSPDDLNLRNTLINKLTNGCSFANSKDALVTSGYVTAKVKIIGKETASKVLTKLMAIKRFVVDKEKAGQTGVLKFKFMEFLSNGWMWTREGASTLRTSPADMASYASSQDEELTLQSVVTVKKYQELAKHVLNLPPSFNKKDLKFNQNYINIPLGSRPSAEFEDLFYTAANLTTMRQLLTIQGAAKLWLDRLDYVNSFISFRFSGIKTDNWRSYKSYWSDVYNWWNNNLVSMEHLRPYFLYKVNISNLKQMFYSTNLKDLLLFNVAKDKPVKDFSNGKCLTSEVKITTNSDVDKIEGLVNKIITMKQKLIDVQQETTGGGISRELLDEKFVENLGLSGGLQNKPLTVANFVQNLGQLAGEDLSEKEASDVSNFYLQQSNSNRDVAKNAIIRDYKDYSQILGGYLLPSSVEARHGGSNGEGSIPENFQNYLNVQAELFNLDSPLAWSISSVYNLIKYAFLTKQSEGKIPVGVSMNVYCKLLFDPEVLESIGDSNRAKYKLDAELGLNFIINAAILETLKAKNYKDFSGIVENSSTFKALPDDKKSIIRNKLTEINNFNFKNEIFGTSRNMNVGQIKLQIAIQKYMGIFYNINKIGNLDLKDKISGLFEKGLEEVFESNYQEINNYIKIYINDIAPKFQVSANSYFKSIKQTPIKNLIKDNWSYALEFDDEELPDAFLKKGDQEQILERAKEGLKVALSATPASVIGGVEAGNEAERQAEDLSASTLSSSSSTPSPTPEPPPSPTPVPPPQQQEPQGLRRRRPRPSPISGGSLHNKTLKRQKIESKLGGKVMVRKTEKMR